MRKNKIPYIIRLIRYIAKCTWYGLIFPPDRDMRPGDSYFQLKRRDRN